MGQLAPKIEAETKIGIYNCVRVHQKITADHPSKNNDLGGWVSEIRVLILKMQRNKKISKLGLYGQNITNIDHKFQIWECCSIISYLGRNSWAWEAY